MELPKNNQTALMQALAHTPTIVAVCCGAFLDQWHLYKGGIFDESAHCDKPLDHSVLVRQPPLLGWRRLPMPSLLSRAR